MNLQVQYEFIFETAPFASCHASTIALMDDGPVAAFFGGTREGADDVGIWVTQRRDGRWSAPVQVADGREGDVEYPCWNPVLFQWPDGPLLLFYKIGPTPRTWWGALLRSEDGGATWSESERLPDGILGPIKNKPEWIDGALLCPSSDETAAWMLHMERTPDLRAWERISAHVDGKDIEAIQPSILRHADGRLQLIARTRQGFLASTWSDDGGRHWSSLRPMNLPNPNSGTDAVTLADGRHLLVTNPVTVPPGEWGGPRTPLTVALSDDGLTWRELCVLEDGPGEYSYPAVIQDANGDVHITYTWQRTRIKHAVLTDV